MPLISQSMQETMLIALLFFIYILPGTLLLIALEDSSRCRHYMQNNPWFVCWWAIWAWPLTTLWIYLRGRNGHEC